MTPAKLIRAALGYVKVPRAAEATQKMSRAGHAALVAAAVDSLGAILLAGEWTSMAFLRYCQENENYHSRFMAATIDGSGDEEEIVAPEIDPRDYATWSLELLDFKDISLGGCYQIS